MMQTERGDRNFQEAMGEVAPSEKKEEAPHEKHEKHEKHKKKGFFKKQEESL